MQITELIWKLFLLLLPGVVLTIMMKQIFSGLKYSTFEFVINSALFGIATLILMELAYSVFNIFTTLFTEKYTLKWGLNLSIWDNLFDNEKNFNKLEIILSYILSIPLGVFYGYILSKKLLNKLFQKIGLTHRYGDDDVWSFYLNSPDTDWILIRDKKNNLTYFGKIRAYSDTNEKRELLIKDVDVYTTDECEHLYQSDTVYLELDNYNFSIESPKIKENENNETNPK